MPRRRKPPPTASPKGQSFDEIAKELGKTEKDIDLGTVAKAAVIDRAVADAAFALKEGEVSAPVKGRFGTVLVQVLKIEPEQVRPFEQAAGELKQELATARAKSEILDIYDKIEDARAEGKSLAEAAENLKLPARTVEAIDRSGRDAAGVPVQPSRRSGCWPECSAPTSASSAIRCRSRTAISGTTSPGSPRRASARSTRSRSRSRRAGASRRSRRVSTPRRPKSWTSSRPARPFADVAAASNLKVETMSGIKRGQASGALSAAAVDAVFRTAKDAAGKADAAQPAEQVVFRVTDIVVPTLDTASEDAKRAVETLDRGLSEDILAEYIAKLESEIGVTINQSALNQVVSGGAGDNAN